MATDILGWLDLEPSPIIRMLAPDAVIPGLVGNWNTPSQYPSQIYSESSCQAPSPIWIVDQVQLNPYVANQGYVAQVPLNPLTRILGDALNDMKVTSNNLK
jgi:hypothetical protein